MKDERKTTLFLCISFFISAAISGIFVLHYKLSREHLNSVSLDEDIVYDASEYLFGIDPVRKEDGLLIISGWAVREDEDLTYINNRILLIDQKQQAYEMPTTAIERGLTEYFNNGYSYEQGGLWAQCPLKEFTPGEILHAVILVTEQDGRRVYLDTQVDIEI